MRKIPERTEFMRQIDLLEARAGDFWIATSDGVAHLNPRGIPQAGLTVATNSPADWHKPGSEPIVCDLPAAD